MLGCFLLVILAGFGLLAIGFTLIAPARLDREVVRGEQAWGTPGPADPQESAVALGLERLEGLEVFEKVDGDLALSLPFREVYDVRPEIAERLGKSMKTIGDEYDEILKEHTRYEIVSDHSGQVLISPFPEEDARLTNELLRQARALLTPPAFEAFVAHDPMHTQFFPDGNRALVYELRWEKGRVIGKRIEGGRPIEEHPLEPGESLWKHWGEMFCELAPSALPALEHFMAEVEGLSTETAQFQLRGLSTRTGSSGLDWCDVALRADARLVAGDAEKSTAMLRDFQARLEAKEGVRINVKRTEVLGDGTGLHAHDIEMTQRTDNPPLPLQAVRPGDVSLYVRTVTKRIEGMGDVDISERQVRSFDKNLRDVSYDVSLADYDSKQYTLEQILDWIELLEREDDHSVVSRIHITLNGKGHWSASVRLTARERR